MLCLKGGVYLLVIRVLLILRESKVLMREQKEENMMQYNDAFLLSRQKELTVLGGQHETR